jgi:muramoyltetrapeptide carboxypeptidase
VVLGSPSISVADPVKTPTTHDQEHSELIRGQRNVLVPAPLRRGDTVGVVSASGPPDSDLLDNGLEFLRSHGLRIRLGQYVCERNGYLAGNDEQRCTDLNTMLADPEVRGVLFARGGYGVMRLLESIDQEAVLRDPKALVGMSDVTALQLSLFSRCGLATFSGPMIAGQIGAGLDPVSEESLLRGLTEPLDGRDLLPISVDRVRTLRSGYACGPLLGGCLSLVVALLGTAHSPDFSGSILLLEDVNEPPYRLDRMLTHLQLSGVLSRVAGIVLGHFLGTQEKDMGEEVERLVLELTAENQVPVVSRVPHGHALPNLTLPHGVPVAINTEPPRLTVCFAAR